MLELMRELTIGMRIDLIFNVPVVLDGMDRISITGTIDRLSNFDKEADIICTIICDDDKSIYRGTLVTFASFDNGVEFKVIG